MALTGETLQRSAAPDGVAGAGPAVRDTGTLEQILTGNELDLTRRLPANMAEAAVLNPFLDRLHGLVSQILSGAIAAYVAAGQAGEAIRVLGDGLHGQVAGAGQLAGSVPARGSNCST